MFAQDMTLKARSTIFEIFDVYFVDHNKKYLKKIYDEVTEDIFDMSNVQIFKEIEKKKCGMFILCYIFGQLSSVKHLA